MKKSLKMKKIIMTFGIVGVYILIIGAGIIVRDSQSLASMLFSLGLALGGALGIYTESIIFVPNKLHSTYIPKSNYYGKRDDLVWWFGQIFNGFLIFIGLLLALDALGDLL